MLFISESPTTVNTDAKRYNLKYLLYLVYYLGLFLGFQNFKFHYFFFFWFSEKNDYFGGVEIFVDNLLGLPVIWTILGAISNINYVLGHENSG